MFLAKGRIRILFVATDVESSWRVGVVTPTPRVWEKILDVRGYLGYRQFPFELDDGHGVVKPADGWAVTQRWLQPAGWEGGGGGHKREAGVGMTIEVGKGVGYLIEGGGGVRGGVAGISGRRWRGRGW
eukprot:763822-Hanusia_phi.AAC.3